MFYTPERLIFTNEQGAFGLDLWTVGNEIHVHAIQLDVPQSTKGYGINENRQKAITVAVESVVKENKKND